MHLLLHATGQQGLDIFFGGACISATQISEFIGLWVLCQEIRGTSFKLGNKMFSKNKILQSHPFAAAAFVLVQPNPL